MGFGERMKEARTARGMTQKQLADAAGVAVSSVSSYEKRGIDPPWESACKIARVLGISLDWFAEFPNMTNKTQTEGDIVRILLHLNSRMGKGFNIYAVPEAFDIDDEEFCADVVAEIENVYVAEFFSGYEKILRSYDAGVIDAEILQLWIEKQLKTLDKIKHKHCLTESEEEIYRTVCKACGIQEEAYTICKNHASE